MSSSGWLVSSDMAHGFSLFYGKPPVCALRELLRFSNGQDGHHGRTNPDQPGWVLSPKLFNGNSFETLLSPAQLSPAQLSRGEPSPAQLV